MAACPPDFEIILVMRMEHGTVAWRCMLKRATGKAKKSDAAGLGRKE